MIRFQPQPADASPAADLIAAMIAEMALLYGPIDGPAAPTARPAEMAPPQGTFLVGFGQDGTPLCAGGVKRLSDDVAELKRMYVIPAARRRGVARALLAALEDAARHLGYTTVRLDTGARQPHAQALYESAGYRAVPDYNDNPLAAYWGEKALGS